MDEDESPSRQVKEPSAAQVGVALVVLLAFLALHNAEWLRQDVVNPLWDEAVYLLRSLEAFDTLQEKGPAALGKLYYQSMGVRPTFFFVLVTQPFYALFGTSADVAILGTNTLVYAVIILATFLLGRYFFDARVGVLAAYVTTMISGVGILSRIYWPHFTVVAVAPLGTYLLFRTAGFSRTLPAMGFGLLLGLGLMMRPGYPALFLLAPALWVVGQAMFSDVWIRRENSVLRRVDWRRFRHNLASRLLARALPSLLLATAIAGPFYYRQLLPTLRFVSFKEGLDANLPANPLYYVFMLPSDLSPYLYTLLLIGLFLAVFKYRSRGGPLAFCFALTLVLISMSSAKRAYYLPPLFPLAGILATFWIFEIRHSWARRAVVGMTILVSLGAFLTTAWGRPEYAGTLTKRVYPLRPFNALDRLNWRMPDIARLIENECGVAKPPKIGFVSHDLMLQQPSFRYLASPVADEFSYANPVVYFETLILADCVVVERPMRLLSKPEKGKPTPIRWRNGRWQAVLMLQNPSSTFYGHHRSVGEVVLDDGRRIEVHARRGPPLHQEVQQLAKEMIDLDAAEAENQIRKSLRRLRKLDPTLLPAFQESLREAQEAQQQTYQVLSGGLLLTRSRLDFEQAYRLLGLLFDIDEIDLIHPGILEDPVRLGSA